MTTVTKLDLHLGDHQNGMEVFKSIVSEANPVIQSREAAAGEDLVHCLEYEAR